MQYSLYSIGPCFYHQSHPQLGVVFAWLHPFILSGVISPLISSSILATYLSEEFLFQSPIFLPFHTVHGVLKARILKWSATSVERETVYNQQKTRLGADCGSDHELLISKILLKLKKIGKTTRPFRYDLNQIPYDYTTERRKGKI